MAPRVEPKSSHVSDETLQAFLQHDFDPADYLNATLPALSQQSTASRGSLARSAPLNDLSAQLQTLLSQLNAQTLRLSNTLTQLADEIVRSGNRLAYEVEILRGETLGMSDAIHVGLQKDIRTLAPSLESPSSEEVKPGVQIDEADGAKVSGSDELEFLTRLRTLTTVRERLDGVVKVFGSAMQWPVAPSDVSAVSSSIISVSAPSADEPDREAKGKEYLENLQSEINAMLAAGVDGLKTANARVEELRALAEVWKGTTEEKARIKIVEALQKLVDEKAKNLETGKKAGAPQSRIMDYRYGGFDSSSVASKLPNLTKTAAAGGYGFLQNLRDFKNEMYAE